MANITINKTEYYNVHKNGGTTIRIWARQYETGQNFDRAGKNYYDLSAFGLPRMWVDNSGKEPFGFRPSKENNIKWCIKRNPIERFISAYTDKILRERLIHWEVDEIIDMLYSGEMMRIISLDHPNRVAALHFLPQVFWLGCDKAYYHMIFDFSEMDKVKNFCEDYVFKMKLQEIHARNLKMTDIVKQKLTNNQIKSLEEIYEIDYRSGWH